MLPLPQVERLDIDLEQGSLYVLPFPSFLLFAPQKLDVLHAVYHLHQVVLIDGHLLEVFPVEVGALAHEQFHPADVEDAEEEKEEEYFQVVHGKHCTEDDDGDGGKQDAQHGLGEEHFYAFEVFDAADQVACQLTVEEAHGQAHQLDEKVRYQGYIDACTDVQQDAAADNFDQRAAEHQHELCSQYELDEVEVAVTDALVYDGLREEGEGELQYTACQKAHYQLDYHFTVRMYVAQQMPQ